MDEKRIRFVEQNIVILKQKQNYFFVYCETENIKYLLNYFQELNLQESNHVESLF